MGYGDDIMATGLARGLAAQGKLAAFGDRKRIVWGPWSEEMFRHNPNIAKPQETGRKNLVWIPHYKGHRLYNRSEGSRWVWNYDFKAVPGEFYFDVQETTLAETFPKGFTVIEPNVPWQKKVALNKDWGEDNYERVSQILQQCGHRIVQFIHVNTRRKLRGATYVEYEKFRDTIAVLSRAALYVGPEGGMHHASAALGIPGVVLFGGFIPPAVTGYNNHINLTGGAEACGNIEPCVHCRAAMKRITSDEVVCSASTLLEKGAAA